jgi:uncharacterized protein YciI
MFQLGMHSSKGSIVPRTLTVVMHLPGPAWKPGVPAFAQAGIERHVEHYQKLVREGKLEAGGPFLDESGGGMMIASEGVDAHELELFAAADPCVQDGLLTIEIRIWLVGMERSKTNESATPRSAGGDLA